MATLQAHHLHFAEQLLLHHVALAARAGLHEYHYASSSFLRTASMCSVIFTLSPTTAPPDSISWFQRIPNSFRLISVVAVNPARLLPRGSSICPSYSPSSTTSLVTSLMVRSPAILKRSAFRRSTRVLRKVMYGNWSALKKLSERRSASRASTLVSTLATAIFASTHESSGLVSSMFSVASRSRNRPFTVATTRCLTANSAIECVGSPVQTVLFIAVSVVILPPCFSTSRRGAYL